MNALLLMSLLLTAQGQAASASKHPDFFNKVKGGIVQFVKTASGKLVPQFKGDDVPSNPLPTPPTDPNEPTQPILPIRVGKMKATVSREWVDYSGADPVSHNEVICQVTGEAPVFDLRGSGKFYSIPASSCNARYNGQDGQIFLTGYMTLWDLTDGLLKPSSTKFFSGSFYFFPNSEQDPNSPPTSTPNAPRSYVLAGDSAGSFTRDLDLKHLGFRLNYGQIFCLTPGPILEPIEGPNKPKLNLNKTGKLGGGDSDSPINITPTEPPQCTQGESLQVTIEIEDSL